MSSENKKGPVSVDMSAMRALSAPPRGRGCFFTTLVFVLLPLGLCAVTGFGLSSMELSGAERACLAVPVGMPRADVEARLTSELGARLLGSGGPSGEPPSSIEVGERGDVISWSCQISLDAAGNATRSHFRSWVVPNPHGRWDDPILSFLEDLLPGG